MTEGTDRAIWATWYDLEEGQREGFYAWLHSVYLPFLAQQPGFLWVTHYVDQGGGAPKSESGKTILGYGDDVVGRASQHVIIVGAADTDPFLYRNVLDLEREVSAEMRQMLDLRRETRSGIFIEEKRIFGPANPPGGYGLLPSPAIMFGGFRMPSVDLEFEIGSWYLHERLPLMARTPGLIRTRKMISVAGWAKILAFYEFERVSDWAAWKQVNLKMVRDPKHWTNRVISSTRHAPGSPTIGIRTYPPLPAGYDAS